MKILLISGHGGSDSGACAIINTVNYKEANETITMVKYIKRYLDKYNGVKTDLYPIERNAYQDLKNGCLKVDFSKYDYVLEVHFNASVNDLKGNKKTTGTEIYIPTSSKKTSLEKGIVKNIAKLGLKNRGVKKYNWAVINNAKKKGANSSLLETCFIDDKDDMMIYTAHKKEVAKAVAKAFVSTHKLKAKE